MENEPLQEMLERVAAKTLEEAAFVFAEPAEEELAWAGELVEVELPFRGPEGDGGRLTLAATTSFGVGLAANLLGLEPGDPAVAAKGGEALGEMLNIIGGALMREWFGAEAVCQLGVPKVAPIPPPVYEEKRLTASCCVSLRADDEHRIDLGAFLDGKGTEA